MPDFRLSPEHEELRKTVEAFAHDVVAPVIGDYYERHAFPYDIVRQMGEMGLFGLPFPEDYGGMGGDYFALCLAIEELARVDSSVAITLEAGVSLGAMPIYRFGTEEQKRQWLPELTAGRMLGAFGLTEASSGSDAGDIATTAVLDGDEWVINGSKVFITNSGTDITGLVTVTARTGIDDAGRPEISAITWPSTMSEPTSGGAFVTTRVPDSSPDAAGTLIDAASSKLREPRSTRFAESSRCSTGTVISDASGAFALRRASSGDVMRLAAIHAAPADTDETPRTTATAAVRFIAVSRRTTSSSSPPAPDSHR